jgi:aspartate/methionine/tyrosine aminotransferase
MIGAADLARLTGYCPDHGIRLISDEIYHGITYESAAARRVLSGKRRSSSIRFRNTTA